MKRKMIVGIMLMLLLTSVLSGAFYFVLVVSPAPEEPIKIGVIGPMNVKYGQYTWEGATLAAEEINATGGVNVSGVLRPIELHSGMEYVNPELPNESADEMERLITEVGVDFVIGGYRNENVFAMREVAMDHQKIFLITGATADGLVDCNNTYDPDGPEGPTPPGSCLPYTGGCVRHNYTRYKYLFRAQPVNSTTLVQSLAYFYHYLLPYILVPLYGDPVKVAVISENFTWADRLHWALTVYDPPYWDYTRILGPNATVVYSARVDPFATNFTAELKGVRDSGARLLIHIFDSTTEAGPTFIRQWAELGIEAIPVGIDVLGQDSNYWLDTDGKCEYEVFLASSGTRTPVTNLSIPFWNAYVERFGHYPVYPVWGAYGAIHTLKEAIERAGTTDSDAVVTELEKTDRIGLLGNLKFTEYHDVFSVSLGPSWPDDYARSFICQWQAGKLEVIWPADQPYSKNFKLPLWAPKPDSIKIGVLGPMDFISGQGMWEGATLAAEKINAEGGILGRPVELHKGMEYAFPDDPAESAAEMERLITDVEVDFLLGCTLSSPTGFAMREVAMDHQKIFFIAGGAAFGELVDCGTGTCGACVRCNYTRYKHLFRVWPVNGTTIFLSLAGFYRFVLEEKLLPLYGELLWEGAPNPQVKVAVITENHTWADGFHLHLTNPALYPLPSHLGPYANVTYSTRVSWNATDFTEELTAIRDSGARLIIQMFSRMDGINFTEQWRDMNIEAVPVGVNIVSQTGEMWNGTSGKCEYQAFLAPSGTRTPITNLSIPFWDAYVARWGHDPIYTSWGAYETIIGLDEMFEANFASMPDLSNQTMYDNLTPLIEQTDRTGTLGRLKYTGPNPNLNSTNYPFYSTNPNFTGTLHEVFSNEIGSTWTQGYARPFIVQWQAGKKEVIWPADQPYSKEFELPPARVSVVPSTDVAVAGQSFTANITVSFAADVCLWAFSISWNPATLDLIDVTEGEFLTRGGSTTGVLIKEINQTGGYMKEAACSLLGSVLGVNGSGTLATITFKATAVGSSPLDIYFCDLLNSTGESISRLVTDSSVDIDAPDLSISSVSLPYPDLSLYVNTTVSVNVTIQNTGNFSAGAFNVSLTAYWNEGEIVDYFGKSTVESLEANTTLTLQFTFTLQYIGNYTLTFNVDCDNDVIEVNETNNELILMIKVKMQGDIDGDDEVTYLDLFDLSRAYWSTPEDTNWNPYADINNDGRVDYNDLFLLAQNYSLA